MDLMMESQMVEMKAAKKVVLSEYQMGS